MTPKMLSLPGMAGMRCQQMQIGEALKCRADVEALQVHAEKGVPPQVIIRIPGSIM